MPTRFEGRVVPLWRPDVDTDQIVPKQFLKSTLKTGYAEAAFHDWRQDPGFVLNDPRHAGATILLAAENFGCGSSREHAAWALRDYGFRAIVAPSFADIFANNAARNGLLCAAVPAAVAARWASTPDLYLTLDLTACVAHAPGEAAAPFAIPAFHRRCLLEGLDEIALALAHEDAIGAFESSLAH